jgi:aminoglycoside phosphotransferase (APT) family kinase protein
MIDEAARHLLAEWLSARTPVDGSITATLISGGRSNLTYDLRDEAGGHWVLRRPPEGLRVATAHDVLRECMIMRSVARADTVPVPAIVGDEADTAVIGAPFFVMDHVDGVVLRGRKQSRTLDEASRAAAGSSIIDVLAAIHALDLTAVELDDLAARDGYLGRQRERWYGSYRQLGGSVALVDEVHDWLAEREPASAEVTLVHGDFRLDNAIVDEHGQVRAVLDWELATLGDPLADLALTVVYWAGPDDEAVGPTALPGFPTRAQVVDRYADRSGRALSHLGWHLVFAYWKLACIAQQVSARYAAGGGGGDRHEARDLGAHIERFARKADGMRELAVTAGSGY